MPFRGIMHLTYHDSLAHTNMASAAAEAGAPKEFGFLSPDAFAPGRVTTVNNAPDDATLVALEAVFYDWWAANYSCLDFGGAGDVLGLRLALNAAFAKACISGLVTPKAL